MLLAVRSEQVLRVDPGWPLDDLTLPPYVPPEHYLRLRVLEWRRRDAPNDLRQKLGEAVNIDTVRGVGYRLDVMDKDPRR